MTSLLLIFDFLLRLLGREVSEILCFVKTASNAFIKSSRLQNISIILVSETISRIILVY